MKNGGNEHSPYFRADGNKPERGILSRYLRGGLAEGSLNSPVHGLVESDNYRKVWRER